MKQVLTAVFALSLAAYLSACSTVNDVVSPLWQMNKQIADEAHNFRNDADIALA